MVDAFTGTSALSNTIAASVDQFIRAELRHTPMLRNVADTRPISVDKAGSSVALYIHGDLDPVTTPLSETTDPDFVALPNPTPTTLTPYEYGNATISTIKAKATSFADVDPYQRDAVMYNMRDTLDVLVRDIISAGDNVRYATGGASDPTSTATVDAEDVITTADIRYCVSKLRGNAAQGRIGDLYWGGIHPDVSHDLKSEAGAGGFQDLHKYAAPGVFWPGVIGVYEGVAWVESARMKYAADGADLDGAGSGTTLATVHRTIICGKEFLAEGVQVEPEVRIGVVPDRLNRFFPMGWYGFLGWTLFRQNAGYRIESSSSIS